MESSANRLQDLLGAVAFYARMMWPEELSETAATVNRNRVYLEEHLIDRLREFVRDAEAAHALDILGVLSIAALANDNRTTLALLGKLQRSFPVGSYPPPAALRDLMLEPEPPDDGGWQ